MNFRIFRQKPTKIVASKLNKFYDRLWPCAYVSQKIRRLHHLSGDEIMRFEEKIGLIKLDVKICLQSFQCQRIALLVYKSGSPDILKKNQNYLKEPTISPEFHDLSLINKWNSPLLPWKTWIFWEAARKFPSFSEWKAKKPNCRKDCRKKESRKKTRLFCSLDYTYSLENIHERIH